MSKRTDVHRPGAIVPTDYELVMFFAWPIGDDIFGEGIEELLALMESHRASGGKVYGSGCNCGVCGAGFSRGTVWRHTSGDLVTMGCDCAEKYRIAQGNPGFSAQLEALDRNRAARISAHRNETKYNAFCSRHEGLKEALETDHYITRDLKRRLRVWHELSDKQVALALKLAREANTPKEEEKRVPAPVSDKRMTIEGVIVSKKLQDTAHGSTMRMTVKVETPDGSWLAWGTCPTAYEAHYVWHKGDRVRFECKLEKGSEPHFAFFKRPTKAERLEAGEESTIELLKTLCPGSHAECHVAA